MDREPPSTQVPSGATERARLAVILTTVARSEHAQRLSVLSSKDAQRFGSADK